MVLPVGRNRQAEPQNSGQTVVLEDYSWVDCWHKTSPKRKQVNSRRLTRLRFGLVWTVPETQRMKYGDGSQNRLGTVAVYMQQ